MLNVDSLQLKGQPANIPDCDRNDLPRFFVEMGYRVGAEIGTATGKYAQKFCQAGLKLYCIDPWKEYEDYKDANTSERLSSEYEGAKRRLESYDCTIIRKMSMEAVKDFEDGSLDFVYIDGHHGFKYVAEDLWEWSKKVRKGGIISGHDYFIPARPYREAAYVLHTKYVVDAYTKAMRMPQWYVIGRREKVEGEKRDRFRSFMWINP